MKVQKLLIVWGVTAVALAASALVADPGKARGGPGVGQGWREGSEALGFGPGLGVRVLPEILAERADRVAEALELTETQREAARTIGREALQAARPKLDEMRILHQELEKLLEAPKPNVQAVGEKTLALHKLRTELKTMREQALERFRALLDANQKEKLEAVEALRPRERKPAKGCDRH